MLLRLFSIWSVSWHSDIRSWFILQLCSAQNVLYNRRKERSPICAGFDIRCWLVARHMKRGRSIQPTGTWRTFLRIRSIIVILSFEISQICLIVSYSTAVIPISHSHFPQTIPIFFTVLSTPELKSMASTLGLLIPSFTICAVQHSHCTKHSPCFTPQLCPWKVGLNQKVYSHKK